MIKYLIMGFVLLVSPAVMSAPKSQTNYDKIIAEWSNSVSKQTHSIQHPVFIRKKSNKKSGYALLLQQWKTEVKKISKKSYR
jgi:hypothetical protein